MDRDLLKSYIERVQALEEAKASLSQDVKDVLADAERTSGRVGGSKNISPHTRRSCSTNWRLGATCLVAEHWGHAAIRNVNFHGQLKVWINIRRTLHAERQ